MAEPIDMILPMLRELRAELAAFRGETMGRFDTVDRRLATLESTQANFKHALSADSLLSKLVTGEFEGRIEVLERGLQNLQALGLRVERLEAGK